MACRLSKQWLRPMQARQFRARCCGQQKQSRWLSCSTRLQTDGVFRALTENRTQTPWIQALRKKQHDGHDPTKASGKAETPADRDLSARKMSDSYHSVVWPSVSPTKSPLRLTDADVDSPIGPRPLAVGHILECNWSYQTWNDIHGS